MSIDATLLAKLGQYDTATICNVIELFEVRPRTEGYMDSSVRAAFPELPPVVGVACTARFRASAPSTSGNAYAGTDALCELLESSAAPPLVVCEDLDDPSVGATFGEVMCSAFKSLGAVGLITSGAGRDLAQIRGLQFPVFIKSIICSHAYCHAVDAGQPVRVGGLAVSTGDLLHGDANGVTSIPREIAADVADVAEEFLTCEAQVIEYAREEGKASAADLRVRRRAMAEGIDALRRRVSRRVQVRR